jgi:hypothetical protein
MAYAVVVDAAPVEVDTAQRALANCNAALGPEKCVLASDGVSAHWYAVVRFDPERKAVLTIQLYDGGTQGIRVASSELEFKDRDTELERWASAGVVVAALVAAQSSAPQESEPKPVPVALPAPVRVAPPPAPRVRLVPVQPVWVRMDLGATGGSEIEHGALRFGAIGRVGLAFREVPVFAFGSAAYTVRGAGTPDLTWLTTSLGFGVHVGFAGERGALDVRTEGVFESVTIHASNSSGSASAQRTRLGPRFGLDLSGYFAKNLALVAGVEAAALLPRVEIFVGGTEVNQLPPFNWGFISAVRYDFR